MTGMRNRMSVARCCCNCVDCCNGAYPDEWDASFSISDAECVTCDDFIQSTYNLTFRPEIYTGPGTCSWGYYWQTDDPFERGSCQPTSGPYSFDGLGWRDVYLKMRITCISATSYYIRVVLGIKSQGSLVVGSAQKFEFQTYVDVADWNCTEITEYCIPLSFWQVGPQFTDYWNGYFWRDWIGPSDLYRKLCEPPTEICLTAIP